MSTEQGLGAANAEALNGCSIEPTNMLKIASERHKAKKSAQPSGRTTRGVSASTLQAMTFAPVRWLVDGYIAEGLTILAGKPKVGKSWLVLDIAQGVATGSKVLGNRQCRKGAVLYAALEDTLPRLKDRMAKVLGRGSHGTWPPNLTFWTHGDMERLDAGGIDQLREWIEANSDATLIIIDTLAVVRSALKQRETNYDADYRVVGAMKALADEAGVAIIVVTHARKMAADDPWDTVSGTLAITGAADTTLMLTRDQQGVILRARGRDVAEIETAVELTPDNFRWRELGDASVIRRSNARQQLVKALLAAGEPMGPKDLANETGQSYPNVRKLLPKMVRDGEVLKVDTGKYLHPSINPDHGGHSDPTQGEHEVSAVTDVTATARRRAAKATPRSPGVPRPMNSPPQAD